MILQLLLFLFSSEQLVQVNGLPKGSPYCVTAPRHNGTKRGITTYTQKSAPPACSQMNVLPSGEVQITIKTEQPYRGILICTGAAGHWDPNTFQGKLRTTECTGVKNSLGYPYKAVTHTNRDEKTDAIVSFRKAEGAAQEAAFVFIILNSYDTYWTNIRVGEKPCDMQPPGGFVTPYRPPVPGVGITPYRPPVPGVGITPYRPPPLPVNPPPYKPPVVVNPRPTRRILSTKDVQHDPDEMMVPATKKPDAMPSMKPGGMQDDDSSLGHLIVPMTGYLVLLLTCSLMLTHTAIWLD